MMNREERKRIAEENAILGKEMRMLRRTDYKKYKSMNEYAKIIELRRIYNKNYQAYVTALQTILNTKILNNEDVVDSEIFEELERLKVGASNSAIFGFNGNVRKI